MQKKNRYRDLMRQILQAHQEFKEVWNKVREAELRQRGLAPDARHFSDYKPVWEANGIAYQTAQAQANRRNEILNILWDELPLDEFCEGQTAAIDSILDFLETDVLAFRCGYIKEQCFRKLKSLSLNEQQSARLRQLTLAMCQFQGQRRELRELARLMICLANETLVRDLRELAEDNADIYNKQKAERVLRTILHSRRDLK